MKEQWYTITGNIDPNTAQQLIMYVNNQLYIGGISKLKILLSSGGGDVDSAIRIYFYLKSLPFDIEVIGLSQIDSAANIIFVAGKKRTAVKGTRFFLHEGSFTIGNPTANLHTHEETLTILKELYNKNINILATETGKTESQIKKALQESTVLSSEKAIEFGILHEIVDTLPFSKQV